MKILITLLFAVTLNAQTQTTVNGRKAYSGAVNAQTATYQALVSDFNAPCGTIPVASGTFTITLVASGSQPPAGQCVNIINYGSGVVTVARSGQNINGGTASLTIAAATATAPTGAMIVSDGTNYVAQAFSGAVTATSCTSASTPEIGLCLVEEHTASTSAELDFTTCISGTYDDYVIRIVNLIPATSAQDLKLQVSTDGGSTYDATSGHYANATWTWVSGGASAVGNATSTYITVGTGQLNTTANYNTSGEISFTNPSGANFKNFYGHTTELDTRNSGMQGQLISATYIQTTAFNAFRFIMSSGNITSGTIRCYGVAK